MVNFSKSCFRSDIPIYKTTKKNTKFFVHISQIIVYFVHITCMFVCAFIVFLQCRNLKKEISYLFLDFIIF